MSRIESLDWLRGIMAAVIMVYHSVAFSDIGWAVDASSTLGRLGIYGVSIFFVLSGLSMAHVYFGRLDNAQSIWRFLARRAFRIWPLLTLVVAMSATIAFFSGNPYSVWMLVINVTGLFNLVDAAAYINTGAWSIGNEVMYYLLTPPLLWLYARNRNAGDGVAVLSVLIGCFFAFQLLSPEQALADQWATYVHPLNNLFLYVSGIAIFVHLSYSPILGQDLA